MKKILSLLIGIIFIGCTPNITGDEKTAEDFIKSQGYTIIARKGEIQKYTLERSKLYGEINTLEYQQAWEVQTVEPDKYFGKEIVVYGYTVKNNPMQKEDRNAKDGVNVYVLLC